MRMWVEMTSIDVHLNLWEDRVEICQICNKSSVAAAIATR